MISGLIAGIFLAADIVLLFCASKVPGFADIYSRYIYPLWVAVLGRITAVFSGSVVEVLLYMGIFCILLWMITVIRSLFVDKKEGTKRLKTGGRRLGYMVVLLFSLYVWNCGINYQKTSFAREYDLNKGGYTTQELMDICEKLTLKVNDLSELVQRDENGIMVLEGDEIEEAQNTMRKLSLVYTSLGGYYPPPKPVWQSVILSVQEVTGVYSPFTIEANYNRDMPDFDKPLTMCHELSHLKGYMNEDEANYIGYLACIFSGNQEFQYSGNLSAWVYCCNELYKRDKDSWANIYGILSEMAKADLSAGNEFWSAYEGSSASKIQDQINDTYLKANGQAEGIGSYTLVVDLIVGNFNN